MMMTRDPQARRDPFLKSSRNKRGSRSRNVLTENGFQPSGTCVKRQPACKPGSVWPPSLRTGTWRPFILDAHCCAPHATYPGGRAGNSPEGFPSRHPYSVLLPVGFAMPLPLPVARWALTPPFHPCRASARRPGEAVCFLWHFPWGRPRRPLAGTVSPWSPDFPHAQPFGIRACGRPAGWRGV